MYRQAAITWVVFLPCVILLLTAILKKLKAVSIQCWFNFNWTPNCWILFLPKIDKYLRYLISINLRKRGKQIFKVIIYIHSWKLLLETEASNEYTIHFRNHAEHNIYKYMYQEWQFLTSVMFNSTWSKQL